MTDKIATSAEVLEHFKPFADQVIISVDPQQMHYIRGFHINQQDYSRWQFSNIEFVSGSFEKCNFNHAVFAGGRLLAVKFLNCQTKELMIDCDCSQTYF